jgi:HAD superfamily hydrolase (TIGR01509 family)
MINDRVEPTDYPGGQTGVSSDERGAQISQPPGALLFDMDGTLTEPYLDFEAIRREIGIAPGCALLEAIAAMEPGARTEAETILHGHEESAATNSTLNPGCDELIAWVREQGLPTALITRNSRVSAACVLERHGLEFDVLITRDDGKFKPEPDPLLLACDRLNVRPADAWMIGDGSHDIIAGRAAGVPTVWISHGRPREFDAEPWQTVRDLHELLRLLRSTIPRV